MGAAVRRRGDNVRTRSNDDVRPKRAGNVRPRSNGNVRPRSGDNVRLTDGAVAKTQTSGAVSKMAPRRRARLPRAQGVPAVNSQESDAPVGRCQGAVGHPNGGSFADRRQEDRARLVGRALPVGRLEALLLPPAPHELR
ncbi:unnamed protein product [Vitrella brassicaformis CCMP3155]|uniref:Uncharacterized protein n=1 Tax=Vitrella brassicaformis (strain CCMP3155) TaxID=1169540 RepID=A0A0G4GL97_VITBC|nr:unnamed protein product [Vitrella brassicaformis CCMP3155]|eukprot:CEM30770.1 unnamed protein product [Vitrella brassicaformis CCMP3155]